jgi:hypothetical protein
MSSRRPARITQPEVDRMVRAAKKVGATEVEIKLDSDGPWVKIVLSADKPMAESDEIVI